MIMTPRYSVTFSLLPRPHRDGTHSVAVTVTWCRRRYRHTLPAHCPPECWQPLVQLARPSAAFRDSAAVNGLILDTRQAIDDLFTRSALSDTIPTEGDLDRLLKGGRQPEQRRTLAATLDEFVATQSRDRSWQPGTTVKFAMLGRELAACGITYLDEINEATQAKFHAIHASHGLRNTTLAKKIAILQWFVRWCNQRGYTSLNLVKPHLRTVPRTVTYLEWDELLHLYHFDYGEHHSLAHVRDIFCFQAFTGLRFSDAAALRWSDIEGDTLRLVTVKTADPLVLPLNKYARTILERYTGTRGRVMQAATEQATNRLLKDAAMVAQLDRPVRQVYYVGNDRREDEQLTFEAITTHWARRTFVVHALRLGIPAEVVMRFTGHSGYSAMRPYIAIADELKAEAMQRFDDA